MINRENETSQPSGASRYGELFSEVSRILFEDAPIQINFGDNTDEYDPEARTIIPRLKNAASEEDVEAIVFEEFCRWFDAETVGEKPRYREASLRIWKAWIKYQSDAAQ